MNEDHLSHLTHGFCLKICSQLEWCQQQGRERRRQTQIQTVQVIHRGVEHSCIAVQTGILILAFLSIYWTQYIGK